MSRALTDGLRRHGPHLLLELVVVVLGITISFAFQDWRQARTDRAEERRLLDAFATELRLDVADLRQRGANLAEGVGMLQQLLDPTVVARDDAALDRAMDHALGYMSFAPSMATYAELRQTGASRLLRDKDLLRQLIALYDRLYPMAGEWDLINRKLVLDSMFPYIDDRGPAFAADLRGAFAHGYHAAFRALENEAPFRNRLRTCALFKEGQRGVYATLATAAEALLRRLEAAP